MEYLLLAVEAEDDFAAREDPARAGTYWASWQGYIEALTASGVLRGAGGLTPPAAATTLRLREGRRLVQDGPYAETKEQLGGYFVLEVPDVDTAMEWAARCPSAATGSVEVRPLLAGPPPA
jgi:hypothetical protein